MINFNKNKNVEAAEANSEQLNNLKTDLNPARDFFAFISELIKTGIVVFVLAVAIRYFAIQPYIVDGESMMPNYHNQEYLLAEKVSYLFDNPKRGDVVVFKYPKNPSVNYIKRVVGLPFETVIIENNTITIKNDQNPDGFVLKESYIPENIQTIVYNEGRLTKKLQANEYFVLGDNREHSSDSREWGVLPRANIAGRAWVTLLPIDRFGVHKRVN